MSIAVYPGSFDPITLGHLDLVSRASRIFDQVIMAIVNNPNKTPFIPLADRRQLVSDVVAPLENVTVVTFEGLTVSLAQKHEAHVLVRGLRAVSDFDYEVAMSQINHKLACNIETVFLAAALEYQFLSSSMIREVAQLGGDIHDMVPPLVNTYIQTRR